MSLSKVYCHSDVIQRESVIQRVTEQYGFSSVHQLNFSPAELTDSNKAELIQCLSKKFKSLEPNVIYLPYRYDVHSNHQIVADSVISASKTFRCPFIEELLAYETLSETEFNVYSSCAFFPNYFVDISQYILKKIEIVKLYRSELGDFPFPRSVKAIEALSSLRGSQANTEAAEAFMLLKKIR